MISSGQHTFYRCGLQLYPTIFRWPTARGGMAKAFKNNVHLFHWSTNPTSPIENNPNISSIHLFTTCRRFWQLGMFWPERIPQSCHTHIHHLVRNTWELLGAVRYQVLRRTSAWKTYRTYASLAFCLLKVVNTK